MMCYASLAAHYTIFLPLFSAIRTGFPELQQGYHCARAVEKWKQRLPAAGHGHRMPLRLVDPRAFDSVFYEPLTPEAVNEPADAPEPVLIPRPDGRA